MREQNQLLSRSAGANELEALARLQHRLEALDCAPAVLRGVSLRKARPRVALEGIYSPDVSDHGSWIAVPQPIHDPGHVGAALRGRGDVASPQAVAPERRGVTAPRPRSPTGRLRQPVAPVLPLARKNPVHTAAPVHGPPDRPHRCRPSIRLWSLFKLPGRRPAAPPAASLAPSRPVPAVDAALEHLRQRVERDA